MKNQILSINEIESLLQQQGRAFTSISELKKKHINVSVDVDAMTGNDFYINLDGQEVLNNSVVRNESSQFYFVQILRKLKSSTELSQIKLKTISKDYSTSLTTTDLYNFSKNCSNNYIDILLNNENDDTKPLCIYPFENIHNFATFINVTAVYGTYTANLGEIEVYYNIITL